MIDIQQWLQELKQLDKEQLQQTIESYSAFGPLPGLLLPLLEAFLPFLPLLLFVAVNANVYGLWLGFLLSWGGVSAGSILMFLLARKVGGRFGSWLQKRYPATSRFFHWIERKGFTPIFLLACFPFSPSFLINLAAGLSTVKFHTFMIAILMGKAVMVFSISLLSFDITDLASEPWRIVIALATIAIMWFGGKRLEARYQ
ncbi:TVP38/TMEM64 family protein [Paenibacillus sambharensis]|uniref:TVP38/TMEM64 family membrane protein n=1 Tax=Paenibacillus sambharensis TaxID=1803190 RepID=A0A2W1LMZ1_9BACL|nr:TVP38/TMEM64 family protein [Paenibacillus sambharensis]PZD93161.1 TVP38/TMEM64 family protein [Paenibacillus sambharensis]